MQIRSGLDVVKMKCKILCKSSLSLVYIRRTKTKPTLGQLARGRQASAQRRSVPNFSQRSE
jgi:hypothetical protein